MNFRNDINALRAIAVLAVVIFHFLPQYLPGGFAGVDVFFVISGYLMTSIIFQGIEHKNFTLLRFYFARARRIIPALAFLCIILLLIGWFYSTPDDYRSLGKHIAGSLSFLSNIIYYSESGYFNPASHEKWLLHTWSLSVEWQFYIIYPILITILFRFFNLKQVKISLLLTGLISFIFCLYASSKWPDNTFYLLPARAWEMISGGLIFLYPLRLSSKNRGYLNVLGILLVLLSYLLLSEANVWPGFLALLPVAGTCLIILAQQKNSLISQSPSLKFIGNCSYSIYLWHWPIVAFLNNLGKTNDNIFILAGIVLSVVLGWLSYILIENQIKKFSQVKVNITLIATTMAIGLLSSYVYLSNGFYHHKVSNDFADRVKNQVMPTRNNGYCFYHFNEGKKLTISEQGTQCLLGNKTSVPTGLVYGDSFAGQYEPFWDNTFTELGLTVNAVTTNWCFPSLQDSFTGPLNHPAYQQCLINRKFVKNKIQNYHFIILGGKWDSVMTQDYLNETFDFIDFARANGVTVYIMASPTNYDTDILKRFHTALYNDQVFQPHAFPKQKDDVTKAANTRLANYAQKHAGVTFISREHLFNSNDLYSMAGVDTPYSLDGMHISLEGSIQSGIKFRQSLMFQTMKPELLSISAGG